MFWNAFVWGLGVSCGGGLGLIGFMLTLWTLNWVTGRTAKVARITELNEGALAALEERNELTVEANAALRDMAESLKEMAWGKS